MRVNNQTTDPVDYEQNGSGDPLPETANRDTTQSGHLSANSETPPFVPAGNAPYTVTFTATGHKPATSCQFSDSQATVSLNDNWTISVSSGCD